MRIIDELLNTLHSRDWHTAPERKARLGGCVTRRRLAATAKAHSEDRWACLGELRAHHPERVVRRHPTRPYEAVQAIRRRRARIFGVPGAGKSTVSRRLAADLGVPYLSSDTIGEIIWRSRGLRAREAIDATWTAYDIVFQLCEEFTGVGLSVILDANLG